MKVNASLKNLRIAPRKTKLVADFIKGLDVDDAISQLEMTVKRSSPYMKKLLLSAVANGENNFGLDRTNLYVYDVVIGAGPTLKRWMPKAYGRAGKILKRTSQITIVLEERIEGKGRKTKEQMDEERKKREAAKKKAEKESQEVIEETKEEKVEKAEKKTTKKNTEEVRKAGKGKGWANKIFNRKSM